MSAMNDDKKIWVDHLRWSQCWDSLKCLSGGGQGSARKAHRKRDGVTAFLKEIKAKTSTERRGRFFREASANHTIRIRGIPRLIESNAHQWENGDVQPYITTEFIEGPTLRRWREQQEHVDLDTAIKTTIELLAILRTCHASEIVHRDVKPDNIILSNSDPDLPVLLDFGLSYLETEGSSLETELGQEVGNRFLRLPELSAGSHLKQNPRSDLSFAAGILLYLLTGQNPDVLQDAEGCLPHQRQVNQGTIRRVAAGPRLMRLLSLFDRAFAYQIADRFMSADAMLEKLEGVMPRSIERSEEALLKEIRESVDTQAARQQADSHVCLSEALRQVERVHAETGKSLDFPVIQSRSDWNVSAAFGRNTLAWIKSGSQEKILSVRCEVREAGDEIEVSLSGEPVFRTSTTAPRYGEPFDQVIRRWLIIRLHDAVTNPDALPPEADSFQEC